MDAGDDFAWNTRDDTDTDNGYICKKKFDFGPAVQRRLFRQSGYQDMSQLGAKPSLAKFHLFLRYKSEGVPFRIRQYPQESKK